MIGYEYYYLFGLDIPLNKFNLGTIKQPRLIDYISKDISIEEFYMPFLINDLMVGRSKDKDVTLELKNKLGSLTFLLFNAIQSNQKYIMSNLKRSLNLLYDTEDITFNNDFTITVRGIIINDSNFDMLCNIVLESQRIDKSQFKFEEEELDPITAEFEKYRKISKQRRGKNEPGMIDMFNYLIHSNEGNMDYDKVLNMTIYQIRNSLETLGHKNNYETMLQYKVSQKFDVKEDVKSWSLKKVVKSSAIDKDV